MLSYLFVYGTLQKEAGNEMSKFVMQHSEIVGRGFMYGRLYKVSWFPGVVKSSYENEKVYGTVFKLKSVSKVFKTLDNYEGFYQNDIQSSLFVRQQTEVFLENGASVNAWVYLYNQKITNEPQISSGDYLKDAKT